MMIDDAPDPILRTVSQLPVLIPDQRRAERLRERCRAKLARRAPENEGRLSQALIAALCLVYLSAVVHDVLRLRGML